MTIVQLVALFYKDQHVENIQKLLGSWLDTTSDSSEDDESNTSPLVSINRTLAGLLQFMMKSIGTIKGALNLYYECTVDSLEWALWQSSDFNFLLRPNV